MKWMVVLAAIFTLLAGAAQADVMITEVMINPLASGDNYGEWFEVYNDGAEDVDMSGWTVEDNDGQSFVISAFTVPAGDYAVFAKYNNDGLNGHVPYDYSYNSAMNFDEPADELMMYDAEDNLMDQVTYDSGNGWVYVEGASIQLTDLGSDNNDPANWIVSEYGWYEGNWDFGTPGMAFDGPYATKHMVISEILYDPFSREDQYAEWFEVHNAGTDTTNMRLWTFEDLGGNSFRVNAHILVAPGEYAVFGRYDNNGYNGYIYPDYVYGGDFPLDNQADEIVMHRPDGTLHDEVQYDESMGWPTAWGASMQLMDVNADNSVASNWTISRYVWPSSNGDFGTPHEAFDGPYDPHNLIISEILYDPNATGDQYGEFFEVYNAGDGPTDLRLWTVKDADSDSFAVAASVTVQPGEYKVLGRYGNEGYNGNIDDDYNYNGAMVMDDDADEVMLYDPNSQLHDMVAYDEGSGWPTASGASMQLTDLNDDNNDPASWVISRNPWPGSPGDFGTPHDPFDGPYYDHHMVITEIMYDPYVSADNHGEYFELYNAGQGPTDIRLWEITSGDEHYRIQSSVIAQPGEYLVLGIYGNEGYNGHINDDLDYDNVTLSNVADTLTIIDPYGEIHDQVMYDEENGWPKPFGASLQLTDPLADNSDPANWYAAMWPWPDSDGDLGTPGVANDGPYAETQIIISEIMYNPLAVSDQYGEWFELHNAGTDTVNLKYWMFYDNDADSFFPTSQQYVAPGEELVFGRYANPGYNGNVVVNFDYDNFVFDHDTDEIYMYDGNGVLIDEVEYDLTGDFPSTEGASIYLADLNTDNNVGSNWYISTIAWPGSVGDFGSPGEENQDIPAPYQIKITEIMKDPAASSDIYGEWFEIVNESDEQINLRLWEFYDNDTDYFRITDNVFVEAGDYCVLARYGNYGYNGGVQDDYNYNGQMILDNDEDDEIIIRDLFGEVQDEVWYLEDGIWPDPTGATMTLPDPRLQNDDPANWVVSEKAWGGSAGDYGSPGWPMERGILTLNPNQTVIPAGGGNLTYGISLVTYLYPVYENCAYWTEAVMPDSTVYPIGNQYFTLTPFLAVNLPNQVQPVPGGAPEGTYTFNAYVGYPETHIMDSFEFTKLGTTGEPFGPEDWLAANPFEVLEESVASEPELPTVFAVGNAYPNPFNPSTSLDIDLPEAGEVEVAVYNVAGQLVATVTKGVYQAGYHTFSIDGSHWASGVYFVRATIPGQLTEMRKIVLMK